MTAVGWGRRCRFGEQGSGTVWAITGVLLVGALALLVSTAAAVSLARHSLSTAADEAALAAANDLAAGPLAACLRARKVTTAAAADLETCAIDPDGSSVSVTVTRRAAGLLAAAGVLRVRARAGSGNASGVARVTGRG